MISSAPPDFWDKVIERIAKLIMQRECNHVSTFTSPNLSSVITTVSTDKVRVNE